MIITKSLIKVVLFYNITRRMNFNKKMINDLMITDKYVVIVLSYDVVIVIVYNVSQFQSINSFVSRLIWSRSARSNTIRISVANECREAIKNSI